MTEQELRTSITPCIMAGNTWFVFEQIKAYADAQVEASIARQQPIFEAAMKAKDTEIAELRDELRVLRETSSEIVVSLFKKYSDSAIIEAENKALKDENEEAVRFSDHTLKEWKSLNAEIKRLREGVEELRKLGDDVVKHVNRNDLSRAKMHASRWDEIWNKWRVYIRDSNHSISPSPVTPSVLPDKCTCVYNFPGDLVKQCQSCKESRLLSPAPVTEDKFSVSAYPKECVPTIEQLTENDGMSMMERLEKRMPPFHKIDSPKNEDQA